ncbi:uncharacterized protein RHOBADRAFT_42518 [Rhodotorula graminis WP1]|uniref:Velvet domain-containing protein n=1 Tax=Rhodotorula graminis (strain WP1) TaxID=578459 RepID=A0A194S6R9_RHOGW|nr:uncharacterized protein RHOBADRAFT_42518 [Rhodotorula graminis WP1]KPV76190.1 hypothetical protein RHOBADRAFT_42518 [Rhodotorula graminis WP1]
MALPPSPTKSGRASPNLYHLDVRQQPRQARMAGSGEKADRRPIDPPPIIRLRIRRPSARKKPAHLLTDDDLATPTLTHTLFMFASLVEEDSEQEMFEVCGSKTAVVSGSVVSSLFHLRDQSCFVFPDMSVRMEGRWRFKMSLYEVSEDGAEFRTSILTDVFQVYSSKRFPGMSKSTELSRSFAQQGLKLRIRRPESVNHEDSNEPPTPPTPVSAPKKPTARRTSNESFAEPTPRRPSAPVASTSQHGLGVHPPPPPRLFASWDAATGAARARTSPQLASRGLLAAPAREAPLGGVVPRPPTIAPAPSAPPHAPQQSYSGPQRTASGSHRLQAHPYGLLQAAPTFPHARPLPPPRAHTFAHQAVPPSSHSYPPPRSRAHYPLHPHSPPPILAPLRHHLGPPHSPSSASTAGSSRPPSAASTSASSSYMATGPHSHHAHDQPQLRLSPPSLSSSSSRPQTQAAESSLRSTDAPVASAASPACDSDRPAGSPARPTPARTGSLAMLLGEGRDAKEVDGGDGEAMFY